MTAEQFLALAETLRSYAQHSGRDLNAANLFVHNTLMRALREERTTAQREMKDEAKAA